MGCAVECTESPDEIGGVDGDDIAIGIMFAKDTDCGIIGYSVTELRNDNDAVRQVVIAVAFR